MYMSCQPTSPRISQSEEGGAGDIVSGLGKGVGGMIYFPINGTFAVVGELADGLWNTPEVCGMHCYTGLRVPPCPPRQAGKKKGFH